MIVVRPINKNDAEAFIKLAFEADIGMTSMPKNRKALIKRLDESIESFAKNVNTPNGETYLFVLEDQETGLIEGTCGILARTGLSQNLTFYHIKKDEQHQKSDGTLKNLPTLSIVRHDNYWSEIGSLYLSPNYRHSGIGRLLSLSRFLFIAAFPERFDTRIFAEMRGYIDKNHSSPFWEGIGQHFADVSFEKVMDLKNKGIFENLQAFPKNPIYIDLLPSFVQEAIGKTHEETKPALKMLIDEGFNISNELDIIDGGPKVEAKTNEIRTVVCSKLAKVDSIIDGLPESSRFILSNNNLDFRACFSILKINEQNKSLAIPSATAKALKVNVGDKVRYATPHREQKE